MKAISIVCDSCGQHAANVTGRTEFVAASTDTGDADAANPPLHYLPTRCPRCGARWDMLHPGDEFLIGLTTVTRRAAASFAR